MLRPTSQDTDNNHWSVRGHRFSPPRLTNVTRPHGEAARCEAAVSRRGRSHTEYEMAVMPGIPFFGQYLARWRPGRLTRARLLPAPACRIQLSRRRAARLV